eukprot:443871-Pelagomonas_calceolata.AAC.1
MALEKIQVASQDVLLGGAQVQLRQCRGVELAGVCQPARIAACMTRHQSASSCRCPHGEVRQTDIHAHSRGIECAGTGQPARVAACMARSSKPIFVYTAEGSSVP